MKKSGIFIYIFCLILLLSGCKQEAQTGNETDPLQNSEADAQLIVDESTDASEQFWSPVNQAFMPEENAQITIWVESELFGEALVKAWNEVDDTVLLQYEVVEDLNQRAFLEEKGPSGTGADVIFLPQDQIQTAVSAGILMELDESVEQVIDDNVINSLFESGRIENKQYTAPISVDTIALLYNKNLVQDFVPESFDSLLDWCRSYYRATGNWGISWEVTNAYYNYFFLSAFGYEYFSGDATSSEPGFQDAALLQGLTYFSEIREKAYNIPSVEATWDNTTVKFQQGLLPYIISGPWTVKDAQRNGVNVGVMPIPKINDNQPRTLSGGHFVGISAYTEFPRAAQNVMLFLLSDKGQDLYFTTTGNIPASSHPEDLTKFSANAALLGVAQQAQYTDPILSSEYMKLVWEPQADLLADVWDNTIPIEEAQKKASESYSNLMQQILYK